MVVKRRPFAEMQRLRRSLQDFILDTSIVASLFAVQPASHHAPPGKATSHSGHTSPRGTRPALAERRDSQLELALCRFSPGVLCRRPFGGWQPVPLGDNAAVGAWTSPATSMAKRRARTQGRFDFDMMLVVSFLSSRQ